MFNELLFTLLVHGMGEFFVPPCLVLVIWGWGFGALRAAAAVTATTLLAGRVSVMRSFLVALVIHHGIAL